MLDVGLLSLKQLPPQGQQGGIGLAGIRVQPPGHLHRAHGAALDHHFRQLGGAGVPEGLGPQHGRRHGQGGGAGAFQVSAPLLCVGLGLGGDGAVFLQLVLERLTHGPALG